MTRPDGEPLHDQRIGVRGRFDPSRSASTSITGISAAKASPRDFRQSRFLGSGAAGRGRPRGAADVGRCVQANLAGDVNSRVRAWVLEHFDSGTIERVEIATNAPIPTLRPADRRCRRWHLDRDRRQQRRDPPGRGTAADHRRRSSSPASSGARHHRTWPRHSRPGVRPTPHGQQWRVRSAGQLGRTSRQRGCGCAWTVRFRPRRSCCASTAWDGLRRAARSGREPWHRDSAGPLALSIDPDEPPARSTTTSTPTSPTLPSNAS